MSVEVIARWEVKGGSYFVEIEEEDGRFFYNARGCAAILEAPSREAAIERVQAMIDGGYFLSRHARLRFKRTW